MSGFGRGRGEYFVAAVLNELVVALSCEELVEHDVFLVQVAVAVAVVVAAGEFSCACMRLSESNIMNFAVVVALVVVVVVVVVAVVAAAVALEVAEAAPVAAAAVAAAASVAVVAAVAVLGKNSKIISLIGYYFNSCDLQRWIQGRCTHNCGASQVREFQTPNTAKRHLTRNSFRRHEGIFISRGKEDALVTLNLVPGKTVYGEKTVKIDVSAFSISASDGSMPFCRLCLI